MTAVAGLSVQVLLLLLSHATQEVTRPSKEVEFTIQVDKERFDPAIIAVRKGDIVTLKVRSLDVAHGLTLSDFGLNQVIINPGDEATLRFQPKEAGTFWFKCTKYCSYRHLTGRQPKLTVIVEELQTLQRGLQEGGNHALRRS